MYFQVLRFHFPFARAIRNQTKWATGGCKEFVIAVQFIIAFWELQSGYSFPAGKKTMYSQESYVYIYIFIFIFFKKKSPHFLMFENFWGIGKGMDLQLLLFHFPFAQAIRNQTKWATGGCQGVYYCRAVCYCFLEAPKGAN